MESVPTVKRERERERGGMWRLTCKVVRMVLRVSVFPVAVFPYTWIAGQVTVCNCE